MKFRDRPIKHTAVPASNWTAKIPIPPARVTGVPPPACSTPTPARAFAGVATINTLVRARSNSAAAYHRYRENRLALGDQWLSASTVSTRTIPSAVPPVAAFNRLDHLPSWRGAVVYKPSQPLSIYVSAGNSFNPSAESLSLSATTTSLPPEENRSYEFGVKWDIAHPGLSFRTAVFRTDKLNAREPDPTNSLLNVLAGKQRVNGFQAEVSGHLNQHWDARLSYAYLDATLRASTFYPLAIGARLANVPRQTFTVWQTYRLPYQFVLGAGGNFVGARTASSTVPIEPIPGLVKQAPDTGSLTPCSSVDHGTRNPPRQCLQPGDRYYYDRCIPPHRAGPARSALMGIRFRF